MKMEWVVMYLNAHRILFTLLYNQHYYSLQKHGIGYWKNWKSKTLSSVHPVLYSVPIFRTWTPVCRVHGVEPDTPGCPTVTTHYHLLGNPKQLHSASTARVLFSFLQKLLLSFITTFTSQNRNPSGF
jgi:hypothetical protein